MMCKPSLIIKFLDQELNESQKIKFIRHLKECTPCQLKIKRTKGLTEKLKNEPGLLLPRSEAIMLKIDTEHYKNSYPKLGIKIWNFARVCRRAAIPALSLILIGILLFIPNTRNFIGMSLMTLLDKENRISEGIDIASFEALSFTGACDQTTGDELVAELNSKGMGVSPWEIIFASEDRILLRNYASLLVYKKGELKKAAELDTLGLNHVQGSTYTILNASPDGRFILAGNHIPSNEKVSGSSAVYLIDADTGRYSKLYEGGVNDLATAWSFNGQWLALASQNISEKIDIINLKTLKEAQLTIPVSSVNSLFISDSGKPAFYTGSQVAFATDYNLTRFGFQNQTTEPFYIDVDKETIWFIQDGCIRSQQFGSDVIKPHKISTKAFGNILIKDWRVQGKYLISLMQGFRTHVFSLIDHSDNLFLNFTFTRSGNLPWFQVSPYGGYILWESEPGHIDLVDGNKSKTLPLLNQPAANLRWNRERTLVYVELLNSNDPKAGEFAIKQIGVNSMIVELYRTVPVSVDSK